MPMIVISILCFQKPKENMINNQQIILNQMNSDSITVKTEVRLPLWPDFLSVLTISNIVIPLSLYLSGESCGYSIPEL